MHQHQRVTTVAALPASRASARYACSTLRACPVVAQPIDLSDRHIHLNDRHIPPPMFPPCNCDFCSSTIVAHCAHPVRCPMRIIMQCRGSSSASAASCLHQHCRSFIFNCSTVQLSCCSAVTTDCRSRPARALYVTECAATCNARRSCVKHDFD